MEEIDFEEYARTTPCVGCGMCCRTAPCALAMRVYPNITISCPALNYREGRWWCDIVTHARGSLKDEYIRTLAIGAGCCSPLGNQDRKNIPTPESLAPKKAKAPPEIDYRQAFQGLCRILGTEFISGDHLYLMGARLKAECGEDALKEYVELILSKRSRFIKEMMG